jgi:hypothetical protein
MSWNQLAHSDVVQKEEWLSATGKYVIYAVIYQVNTDGIMLIQNGCYLQLGAYAVYTGYQHRLLVSLKFKKPAEESYIAQYFWAEGRTGMSGN